MLAGLIDFFTRLDEKDTWLKNLLKASLGEPVNYVNVYRNDVMMQSCKVLIFEPGFSQEIGNSLCSIENVKACSINNLEAFIIKLERQHL